MPFPKVGSPKPSRPRSPRDDCSRRRTVLTATNKSLAQSNKSGADGKATKQRETEHIGHKEGADHELRSARHVSSGLQEAPQRVPQSSDRINAERERTR